jgi:DNA-directed RNA polymerase subunit M/transcription elongation factor TFIIS
MEGFICPKCGKRTMIKKEVEPGKYKLVCSKCSYEHRTLPKDESKKGFA